MTKYFNFIELASTLYCIGHNLDLTILDKAISKNEKKEPNEKKVRSIIKNERKVKPIHVKNDIEPFKLRYKRTLNDNSFIADFNTKWYNLGKKLKAKTKTKIEQVKTKYNSFNEFIRDFKPKSKIMKEIFNRGNLKFDNCGMLIPSIISYKVSIEV